GKLAGVAGPLVFGLVSQATGTGRLGILALVAFFAVGGALLLTVDVAASASSRKNGGNMAAITVVAKAEFAQSYRHQARAARAGAFTAAPA
ncbi:MAG: hypothetical protein IH621_12240, partial [Krumholzibacteria bacterium]|nr:hypothetical protein [Candidatus Krumholzibacteria bacterium]